MNKIKTVYSVGIELSIE